MSVDTFMKVTDGKLDPTDKYESEWVGTDEKKKPTRLGGDGTPVVGIVGKSNAKEMTGMGLLFKGQESSGQSDEEVSERVRKLDE